MKRKKLLIVGSDPGAMEEEYNHPFVGPAGKNLIFMVAIATGKKEILLNFEKKLPTAKAIKKIWKECLNDSIELQNVEDIPGKESRWIRGQNQKKLQGRDILILGKNAFSKIKRRLNFPYTYTDAVKLKIPIKNKDGEIMVSYHPSPSSARHFWGDVRGNDENQTTFTNR